MVFAAKILLEHPGRRWDNLDYSGDRHWSTEPTHTNLGDCSIITTYSNPKQQIMAARNIWQRIEAFNESRPQPLREIKYQKMQGDPFSFLRGTCHLFHEDWPQGSDLDRAPQIWVCGDLHLENFGTYKGIDRQVYFGINDFDEGNLAPLTRDVARLATSTLLVGKKLDMDKADRAELVRESIDTYLQTLATGESLQPATAPELIDELLVKNRHLRRQDLLKKYAASDRSLQETPDNDKLLPLAADRQPEILAAYQQWATQQNTPDFYQCLDIKRLQSGLGSLGVDRYLLLIAGKDAENHYLLDLKEQQNSCLQIPHPPAWPSNARRVIGIQSFLQSHPPALRGALDIADKSFTIRELQPGEAKIKYEAIAIPDLRDIVKYVFQVTAQSHLQGAGQQGAATIQTLMDFAENPAWSEIILDYAKDYTKQVREDFEEFSEVMEDRG